MSLSSKTPSFQKAFNPSTREHAEFDDHVRENELRLTSDLRMAREVQQQLLQREVGDVPGIDLATACVPARELGGDFYNLLYYGGGRLALALGDVSGKGTAAALLGALAMGILRAHPVDRAAFPPEVLAVLNNSIHSAHLDARFVVMLFGALDLSTGRLTLANAGSPYPLLLRNGRVEEITVSGIPLGIVEDTRYDSRSLDLQCGDVIVFASDGILECENKQQEAFGTRRLATLLSSLPQGTSAEDISSAILGATDEFSYTSAPDDDRTLVVLRLIGDKREDFSGLPLFY